MGEWMKKAFLSCMAFLAMSAAAQEYRYEPFSREGNDALGGLKIGSKIESLMEGYGNAWCSWATSTLPAEGQPPVKPASFPDPEDEWSYLERLSDWETMYAANRAFDEDPRTAWCEGSSSDGVGEALALTVDPLKPYLIFAGYGRSKDLWLKNARPKTLRLTVLRGDPQAGATQHGTMLFNLRAVAQSEITLSDAFGYQELKLPKGSYDEKSPFLLVIEIISVYPGSKYKDCLISEVRTAGQG
jgi:hypothetical protein